ncbi:GPP34 family phosphoprotein [Micromonospora sp. NPDC049523]|uniref:GOLPH3/VPS74 family protein n=1 Tax=Micromonospora sp. NPDC049523 TaxID=3155921 RepID=UPI0034477A30
MPALAEDLMQLLLDDDTGRSIVDHTRLDLAIAGAVLLELVQVGRVSPAGPDDDAKPGYTVVRDASPTGDPVLDEALSRLVHRPLKFRKATEVLVKGVRVAVLDRLVERGLLRRDETKVLGIFRVKTWPAADAAHEAEVRARLEAALLHGEAPGERTAAIVALLQAIDTVPKLVRGDRAQLTARADEIVAGDLVNQAVRQAVRDIHAAIVVMLAATVVAAAS